MSLRVGIMGGMFDPVHRGHLQVALTALNALALDHLRLIPCALPNHREGASAPASHRLAMLELALTEMNEPRLQTDDREFHRPGVSYMVDTVASLAQQFPEASLVYVMGRDSFNTLPNWHRWQHMLDYCHLCVVSRPGVSLALDTMSAPAAQWLRARQVTDPMALFTAGEGSDARAGRVCMLDELEEPASSTDIRHKLAAGSQQMTGMPAVVLEYIKQHQLYTTP